MSAAVPMDWRRGQVERGDLDRFLFAPDDVVVVVGQDGLVANVAKYLDGQVVIGIDPDAARNPGVLVPHPPTAAAELLELSAGPDVAARVQRRTMVEAVADDGQCLVALNEVFIGHPSHQSARYRITDAVGAVERQSSSGVVVGTGTGSTGWCQSLWLERQSALDLPLPEDPTLAWFVREAWPSPATGTTLTEGVLAAGEHLTVTAETDGLVVFGDGIESDRLVLSWGQSTTITRANRQLRLLK